MNAHAVNIIKKLQEAGHDAVLAGGCVRDMLLGVEPKDFDIATSAKPEQVEAMFEKTVAVGKAFGVIRVLVEDEVFEVATFREDSRESDGRRPQSVSFATMEGDALRRDFTINGMFYDPIEQKLFDFVGGQEDLENKRLRFIGNPEERIKEDALRILRFYRFAFRLDLEPDALSRLVIKHRIHLLSNVSKERIHDELTKILAHRNAHNAMQALLDDGVFAHILPEVARLNECDQDPIWHPEGNVFKHTKLMFEKGAESVHGNPVLAWGVLLHDIAKPNCFKIENGRITAKGHAHVGERMSREILNRHHQSREFIDKVCGIVDEHMKLHEVKNMKLSTRKKLYAKPYFEDLLELNRLDCLGSHANLDGYNFLRMDYLSMPKEVAKPVPFVMGRDLIAMGFAPCGEFKAILGEVEIAQLENQVQNRDEALAFARNLAEKMIRKSA